MDKSGTYIPIDLKTIQPETVVGCDVFIETGVDNKIRYVLYNSATSVIKSSKIEDLRKYDVRRLFIRSEDKKKYLQYTEANLKNIIRDKNTDIKVKAEIVYEVAKGIMFDVFEQPRSKEQLERTKVWTANIVEFALRHEDFFTNIVNLISYDYTTYSHSVNVSIYGLFFAKYLKFDSKELHVLATGLLLHDIGKTQIEHEILNKRGKLTKDEFERIKMHVELGVENIIQSGCFESIAVIPVLQHHEKCDGSGYPKGIRGEMLHKYGKLAGIVDVYDALTTRRSYAFAQSPFPALRVMSDEMKGSFDVDLLKHFVLFLGSNKIK